MFHLKATLILYLFSFKLREHMVSISPVPSKILISALVLACMIFTSFAVEPQCKLGDDQFLVTFHPHLDAFWLNTDDELKNVNFRPAGFLYAMNQRNSKQIFNSMYDALIHDQKRKYFVSEIVFFKDWYEYLQADKKQNVKKMLKNGQLQIANSGWVENDEAVCYYDDILDQYTVGMNWMYEQFGYINKIGWATDSFGHSHSQVALQHLLGFEFQGIERIDDRYIYQHKGGPLLQFYWQPVSDSNGKKYGGVLNHVRHFLHEVNDLRRVPPSYITNDFNSLQRTMKTLYGKNKMFRFLGNDFEEFNKEEFKNLENSFTQLNANSKSECTKYKYGNPKDYLELVKPYWRENKLQTRQNDFMSNWDQDRYWSGYFTTDPDLKIICKQFSRLINLVRKIMVKSSIKDKTIFTTYHETLLKAEELLSIMQHHDGITATSKSYIEKLFKDRMTNSSRQLIQIVQKVDQVQSVEECRLFENHNTCNVTQKQSKLTLSIFHEGVAKKQRIEIILPDKWVYTVDGVQSFVVASPLKQYNSLIFETQIKPGQNDFKLKGEDGIAFKGQVKQFNDKQSFDNGEGIKVSVKDNSSIHYQFGQNFMQFSFHTSTNNPSRRQTVSWNKYGQKYDKTQSVQPGIYIMSNNGEIRLINPKWLTIKVAEFGNYYRLFFDGDKIDVILTFKKDDPSHVEHNLVFTPNGYTHVDYFLKIDSNVKNAQNEFYHDSNGYLVAKRKIGNRPDYDWVYKPQDKINANTYPSCSFFYQTNEEQKFIAFIDRALGITTYDGSMLINIDRLAGDDYKGVGEGYSFIKENRFNFRFAITSKDNDLERVWQRSYDDSLLGFFTSADVKKNEPNLRKTPAQTEEYLKYTLTFLNKDEILLRLHNLAEHHDLKLSHFGQKSWIIPEINLNVSYTQIKESFANGLIVKQRHNWIGDKEEISHTTRGSADSSDSIVLRPLEIRSFRINLSGRIVDRQVGGPKSVQILTPEIIKGIEQSQSKLEHKSLVKHSLRKRCF